MRGAARSVGRSVVHGVTRGRQRSRRWLEAQTRDVRDADVLEIGSGREVDGAYPYSFSSLFDESCRVTMSDVVPEHGHRVLDVSAMGIDEEFDVVLCASVLEHVPEAPAAAREIHRALRPGGVALVTVPLMYPLHDEPGDFWRFTEHGLRHLFRDFEDLRIERIGARVAPFTYLMRAVKAPS